MQIIHLPTYSAIPQPVLEQFATELLMIQLIFSVRFRGWGGGDFCTLVLRVVGVTMQ